METLEEMRRRAEEAERRAVEATNGVERETFLQIAKKWRRLIELCERAAGLRSKSIASEARVGSTVVTPTPRLAS